MTEISNDRVPNHNVVAGSCAFDHSRVTFLLGSGVSIPSGYPSTAQITNTLLTNNWLFPRDQARSEIPLHSALYGGVYSLRAEAIMGLVRVLKSHVDQHLALHGKREASYEDIYYLARQLLDGLQGEYDNPGLLPLMFELRTKASLMVENLNALYRLDGIFKEREQLGLEYLLTESLAFIEEAVVKQLALRCDIKGLNLLDEFLTSDTRNPIHVVTLNHDTLLEAYLLNHGIADGFVPLSTGAYVFNPSSFANQDACRVRLLKLHGSINWYRYKTTDEEELIVKAVTGDRDHIKGKNGEDLRPAQNRLLLAGTTNKEIAYGSGIFLELMFQFHKRLKETHLLVVSGYGFADKGINNRLWAWLDSRPENRMIILHEKLDELRSAAKPSFALNLKRHWDAKKITVIPQWLCDTSLEDIKREIRILSR